MARAVGTRSSIGWIDIDNGQQDMVKKAMLLANKTEGTRDSLGISSVQDAFSNRLFPAVTTLHTKARYMLVIPYLMEDLRRDPSSKDNRLEKFREAEEAWTRELTRQGVDLEGIIGAMNLTKAGKWVKQPASRMYWSSIRYLGIPRTDDLPPREFLTVMRPDTPDAAIANGKRGNRDDDPDAELDSATGSGARSLWTSTEKVTFASLYNAWDEKRNSSRLQIELTSDEAQYLHDKISQRCPGSLYKLLLEDSNAFECAGRGGAFQGEDAESASAFSMFMRYFENAVPGGKTDAGEFESVMETCKQARAFSRFVFLLRVQLNVALEGRQGIFDGPASERWEEFGDGLVEEWTDDFDVETVYRAAGLERSEEQVSSGQRERHCDRFLEQAHAFLANHELGELRELIERRERWLKKGRSVFQSGTDGWVDGGLLDFRFPNGLAHVEEIRAALNGEDDEADA